MSGKGRQEEKKVSLEHCITDGREENGKGHKLQHAEIANSHFHFSSITHIHTPLAVCFPMEIKHSDPKFNNF